MKIKGLTIKTEFHATINAAEAPEAYFAYWPRPFLFYSKNPNYSSY